MLLPSFLPSLLTYLRYTIWLVVSENHLLRFTFLRGKRVGEVEAYATKISYSFFLLKI